MTPRRLAAQVIFGCADSRDTSRQRKLAAVGVGGIVVLGNTPAPNLKSRLRSVHQAAPKKQRPATASDEEGGSVQRLARLIYPLPSAETMGRWSSKHVRQTAKRYGTSARKLAGMWSS
jgi:beta-glucosidase-like glycosyl hydrolase